MILANGLTSTEAIRGAIGASADALEYMDRMLLSLSVEQELIVDIDTWLPEGTTRDTIVSEGAHAPSSTTAARRYYLLKAFSKYYSAWLLAPSMEHELHSGISDGQNDASRITSKVEDVLKRLQDAINRNKDRLLDELDQTTTTPANWFSAVGDNYDPIEGPL